MAQARLQPPSSIEEKLLKAREKSRKLKEENEKLRAEKQRLLAEIETNDKASQAIEAKNQELFEENNKLTLSPPCFRSFISLTDIKGLDLEKPTLMLGRGSIYKATYQGKEIAIVSIRKDNFVELLQEYDMLYQSGLRFPHPNVHHFCGMGFTENIALFVFDWYEHYSVDGCLGRKEINENVKNYLTNYPSFLTFIHGVVEGLGHLHHHGIVHRDLESYNIAINKDFKPKIRAVDVSFFSSVATQKGIGCKQTTSRLTEAPESIHYRNPEWSFASDVWCFGMTILQILYLLEEKRYQPYGTHNYPWDHVAEGKFPPAVTDLMVKNKLLKILIKKCLSFEPKDRPATPQISEALCYMYLLETKLLEIFKLKASDTSLILDYVCDNRFFKYNPTWIDNPPKEFWGHDESVMKHTTP